VVILTKSPLRREQGALPALRSPLRPSSRAGTEHWLGVTEGIDTTLARLADKRQQAQRLARTAAPLGLPTLRVTGR
jgi:hypothetical protein